MLYRRPVIKAVHPVYRIDESTFRIGAQLGITAEFSDPKQEMWHLVDNLDGSPVEDVVNRVRSLHPYLSESDVLGGISILHEHGFLEEKVDSTSVIPGRFLPNVNYFRSFPDIDHQEAIELQQDLMSKRILLLGLGGGGANILTLLSGIGVGHVTALDYDVVSIDNLGRQFIYKEADEGALKTEVAKREVQAINSITTFSFQQRKVRASIDIDDLLPGHDLVICAIDEPPFKIQRVVNEAIVKANIPCIFGATQLTHGRVFTIVPKQTGCFDCLHIYYSKNDEKFLGQFKGFKKSKFMPPTIAYAPAIFQITSIMVDEAVRLLTDYCKPKSLGCQFEIDYTNYSSFSHPIWPRFDECPTCGNGNYDDWEIFSQYIENRDLDER